MPQPRIVAVSAGAGVPSLTTALVSAAANAVAERIHGEVGLIELSQVVTKLLGKAGRDELDASAEAVVRRIEQADLLVIGSPVYRASYTGLFKHLFDLVDHRALVGRVVLLTATGGSLEHSLVIEHQFRPLFGFFGALTVPTGLYAQPGDIKDGAIAAPALEERIEHAAAQAASLFFQAFQPAAAARAV